LVHAASGCAGGVSTALYEVRGGGHRLSAGDDWTLLRLLGRASPDIDPGALLLEFALRAGGAPGPERQAHRPPAVPTRGEPRAAP
jgi:hypothetical protein